MVDTPPQVRVNTVGMKYTCVGCGAEFEAEPAEKVRCPKCLRQHGLVPDAPAAESAESGAAAPRPAAVAGRVSGARYAIGAAVLVATVAAVVGALLAARRAEQAPAESVSDEQLRKAVVAARYQEIYKIVETIRSTEPSLATGLRRMADRFDYDGMRDLLNQ